MTRLSIAELLLCVGLLLITLQPVRAENPDHVKQLKQTHDCPGCDLSDAKLGGVNAELGDLKGADLTRAYMYKAILRGANLTGALLNNTDLSGADLRNARGADLSGAITTNMTRCPDGTAGPCK